MTGSSTDETVYEVTRSPLAADVDHDTVAEVLAALAVTEPGASGRLVTFSAAVTTEGTEFPMALVATTRNVYEAP